MIPTTPTDPAQRMDQSYSGGVLVEELVHNHPPDGGGSRRTEVGGVVTTTAVTGIPLPQLTVEERQAAYQQAVADAVTLADIKEAALWL